MPEPLPVDVGKLPDSPGWDDTVDTSDPSWDTHGVEQNIDPSLSTTEGRETAARLHEENTYAVRGRRLPYQDEMTADRLGVIMHYLDFLAALNRIVPARYNNFSRYGEIGLNVFVPTCRGGQWMYVCAVQVGYAPEYSTLKEDEHELSAGYKYKGWRGHGLLNLITQTYCPSCVTNGKCKHTDAQRQPYVSEIDAHRVFGDPAPGPDSRLYREALYSFRNHR